ncbi:MAG: outer membrane protein, partial [Terrimicrobiaceae bacterium]
MQIAYAYGSLVGTNTLYSACAPIQTAPDAVCGTGKMGVVGHPIEPPSWRLTFGGPLNFDANVNKRPDLLEPFTMLAKKDGEKTAQVANWTGPYLGLNLGGGSNTASNGNNLWFQDAVYGGVTKNANPNTTGGGLIAGGQAGYSYQLTPMFVVGLETDFQGTTMTGGVNGATYSALPALPTGGAGEPGPAQPVHRLPRRAQPGRPERFRGGGVDRHEPALRLRRGSSDRTFGFGLRSAVLDLSQASTPPALLAKAGVGDDWTGLYFPAARIFISPHGARDFAVEAGANELLIGFGPADLLVTATRREAPQLLSVPIPPPPGALPATLQTAAKADLKLVILSQDEARV